MGLASIPLGLGFFFFGGGGDFVGPLRYRGGGVRLYHAGLGEVGMLK